MNDSTDTEHHGKTVSFRAKIIKETDKYLKAMVLYKSDQIAPFYFSKKQVQIERFSTTHIFITYPYRLAVIDKLIAIYQ